MTTPAAGTLTWRVRFMFAVGQIPEGVQSTSFGFFLLFFYNQVLGLSGFLASLAIVIALLVAPVLALIAYFAVDAVVAEKPEKALAGSSYPLVAKSNCRYASGRCSLENGDVQLEIEKF